MAIENPSRNNTAIIAVVWFEKNNRIKEERQRVGIPKSSIKMVKDLNAAPLWLVL
jgi:hypothetical protein